MDIVEGLLVIWWREHVRTKIIVEISFPLEEALSFDHMSLRTSYYRGHYRLRTLREYFYIASIDAREPLLVRIVLMLVRLPALSLWQQVLPILSQLSW